MAQLSNRSKAFVIALNRLEKSAEEKQAGLLRNVWARGAAAVGSAASRLGAERLGLGLMRHGERVAEKSVVSATRAAAERTARAGLKPDFSQLTASERAAANARDAVRARQNRVLNVQAARANAQTQAVRANSAGRVVPPPVPAPPAGAAAAQTANAASTTAAQAAGRVPRAKGTTRYKPGGARTTGQQPGIVGQVGGWMKKNPWPTAAIAGGAGVLGGAALLGGGGNRQ